MLGSLLFGAGAVSAGLAAYALLVEPYRLELTHPEVPLPRLPSALDGLTVLLLADTHTARWGRREPLLTQLLARVERPDLIIWGGDFLQNRGHGIPHALRLVRCVAERFPGVPTYAVHGNAEHKILLAARRAFERQLAECGVRVLVNAWEPLTLRGETITVVGVDDPYYGHADLERALHGAPPASERFRLLLSHSPQLATQAARAGVDLMLSGHTHGGQVRLPGIGPLKTQNPLARRLDFGLWDRPRLAAVLRRDPGGDLTAYITRGIGAATVPRFWWLAPRFLCRPEVARLTLRRRKG
jgi:hypothetical protein